MTALTLKNDLSQVSLVALDSQVRVLSMGTGGECGSERTLGHRSEVRGCPPGASGTLSLTSPPGSLRKCFFPVCLGPVTSLSSALPAALGTGFAACGSVSFVPAGEAHAPGERLPDATGRGERTTPRRATRARTGPARGQRRRDGRARPRACLGDCVGGAGEAG